MFSYRNFKIKELYNKDNVEKTLLLIPQWIGSMTSLIVHTILFMLSFLLYFFGVNLNSILLVLTTLVSLEAIYLAIIIQISVNLQLKKLHVVVDSVNEIQKDVDEIQKDVDEIQENVDEIQEDVKEIQEDEDDEILTNIENMMNELIKEFKILKKKKIK